MMLLLCPLLFCLLIWLLVARYLNMNCGSFDRRSSVDGTARFHACLWRDVLEMALWCIRRMCVMAHQVCDIFDRCSSAQLKPSSKGLRSKNPNVSALSTLKHCARTFMLGVNGLGTAGLLVCIAYES
ncbi:hypothetical protein L208DRAFT_847521 [Tricholoma matsutake]|nr:hypothetical protein L208DRAFT_847521 [Tricholoma matsutake 945]